MKKLSLKYPNKILKMVSIFEVKFFFHCKIKKRTKHNQKLKRVTISINLCFL